MRTPIRQVLEHKGRVVHVLAPTTSVATALELMLGEGVGSVVVCEGARVVGLVGERHLLAALASGRCVPLSTSLAEVMEPDPPAVSPDVAVGTAMALMTDRRTRHLPVVDDGHLVGLVSIGDLTRWVTVTLHQQVEDLHRYIVGEYT